MLVPTDISPHFGCKLSDDCKHSVNFQSSDKIDSDKFGHLPKEWDLESP